jgi:hypothetical protein
MDINLIETWLDSFCDHIQLGGYSHRTL